MACCHLASVTCNECRPFVFVPPTPEQKDWISQWREKVVEPQRAQEKGVKYDQGKPRVSLIDPGFLLEMGRILSHGAQKYAAHNWRGGLAVSRCLDAAQRHLLAATSGMDADPETGEAKLSQLAQVAINAMFAWWMIKNRPELDDRWKEHNDNGHKKEAPASEKGPA